MTFHSVVSAKSLVSLFIEVLFFSYPFFIFVFKIFFVYVLIKVLLTKCIQSQKHPQRKTALTHLQSTQCNVAQAAEINI